MLVWKYNNHIRTFLLHQQLFWLKTYNLCQGFPKNIFWYFLGWDFTISAQIFWKRFIRNIGQFEPLRQYQNDSNMARAFWRSRGLFYVCLHLFFGCSHMFFLHARYKWDDIGRNRNNVQIQKREKSKKLINKHKKWKKKILGIPFSFKDFQIFKNHSFASRCRTKCAELRTTIRLRAQFA